MSGHDLVVIGAGPGGYVAAIRAAQLGWNVGLVEGESALGGTCLRVGCIPSKALLESSEKLVEAREDLGRHGIKVGEVSFDLQAMLKRKDATIRALSRGIDSLMKKWKVTVHTGWARFTAPDTLLVRGPSGEMAVKGRNILIATGGKATLLPGIVLDGDRVGTSTEALSYPEVPGHLVVIGAGIIGLELGSVWSRLGSRVTFLEYLDRILPGTDDELAREAQSIYQKQGMTFQLGCKVTGVAVEGSTCLVSAEGMEPMRADRVLVATGRAPRTDGLSLDAVGLETDENGRIPVDDQFMTQVPGIYAIGDVIRGPMLAHKAEEEGIACVERLITGYGHVNYDAIPTVVYTQPELASVGKTEAELTGAGVEFKKGVFPYIANGRARALGHLEGRVKILAHARTDRILGVHILGAMAGDLIAEAVVAMEFGASSEDLARTCHAHPTLPELLKEAALAVEGRALHI